MKRIEKTIIVFSIIYLFITDMLLLVGEERVDVYLLVLILTYFLYYAVEPELHGSRGLKRLNPLLIAIAALIFLYRIYMALVMGVF